MGKPSRQEELEIFRSLFLDHLKKHRNLKFTQIGQILSAFDRVANIVSLLRDGVKVTETRSKKIKHLYLEGMSETAIGNLLGVDRRKVHSVLVRLGILQSNRWNVEKKERTQFYMGEIEKMRSIGKTNVEIANQLGLSVRYIGNLITWSKQEAKER